MSLTSIDSKCLISLVEARPGLWNKDSTIYKDSKYRIWAWRDVCSMLNPDFEKMDEEEKKGYAKLVLTKWTNIRDAWKKNITQNKENNKSGTKRPYQFNEQLKFLMRTVNKETDEEDKLVTDTGSENSKEKINIESEKIAPPSLEQIKKKPKISDEEDKLVADTGTAISKANNYSDKMAPHPFHNKPKQIKRKRKISELDAKMIQFMDHHINNMNHHKPEENHHLSFFHCLLPTLRTLNEEQILEFHKSVVKQMQSIRIKQWQITDQQWLATDNQQQTTYSILQPTDQLHTTDLQLQVTEDQQQATYSILQPTDHQLHTTDLQLQATDDQQQATYSILQPTDQLHTTDLQLQATDNQQQATYSILQPTDQLHTTDLQLQATDQLGHSTDFQLQTVDHQWQTIDNPKQTTEHQVEIQDQQCPTTDEQCQTNTDKDILPSTPTKSICIEDSSLNSDFVEPILV